MNVFSWARSVCGQRCIHFNRLHGKRLSGVQLELCTTGIYKVEVETQNWWTLLESWIRQETRNLTTYHSPFIIVSFSHFDLEVTERDCSKPSRNINRLIMKGIWRRQTLLCSTNICVGFFGSRIRNCCRIVNMAVTRFQLESVFSSTGHVCLLQLVFYFILFILCGPQPLFKSN